MGILHSCKPREDIITGVFNPEIFTASLSEVLEYYRNGSSRIHSVYTNANQFFREATYPTDGMKAVLSEVFARLNGDNTVPAIHRLETAFGGGKTHTLIACTHIAYMGKELAGLTGELLDVSLLPDDGEVTVVGIAGDAIPVHKPKGERLIPYTLWGEIAFQTGGESLYREVEEVVTSYAAPGEFYFDAVFRGKKVLIMLDELAQYAARLACAHPGGAEQLAAFLMALHGYARKNSGISIVLTLASATDAFARQTERLAKVLSDVTGKEMDTDDALAIGQEALKGVASVAARDASLFVPVQAAEISKVLGKRLFTHIDQETAQETAIEYHDLYSKNSSLLPDQANRDDFIDQMAAHYPFHPTLIDFLNKKLATAEEFQGTRGVLRVLALAVKNIWEKAQDIPMIHTCHIDMRDARTVNEIISRTGSGDLLPVLNADIGGVDTSSIEGGKSNAELADMANPHPEGWPMHEYVWKTVFLHSLVGRDRGLSSNIFGLTEQDAIFHCCFPGFTPIQVQTALKEIENTDGTGAYYLRFSSGRFYASLEPSVNIALARIRKGLTTGETDDLLDATARKVVSSNVSTFTVVHDVMAPEHIPDKQGSPVLALVSLRAGQIDIDECVMTSGPNRPRIEQNLVFLLVPDTVSGQNNHAQMAPPLFETPTGTQQQSVERLRELARTVLAMRRLKKQPETYGINPARLNKDKFRNRLSEREKALETTVTESYSSLWFPSASGQIIRKEIRTAGGESGIAVIQQIQKVLLDEGELVTAEHTGSSHLQDLAKLFFSGSDTVSLKKLRENFCRIRTWPILESPEVLDQIIRAGIARSAWCLFIMEQDDATSPDELYSQDTPLPFNLDLQQDYSIITVDGARKRGWLDTGGPDPTKIREWIRDELYSREEISVGGLIREIQETHGEVPRKVVEEGLSDLLKQKKAVAMRGTKDGNHSQVIHGARAAVFIPSEEDIILSPKKAAVKGILSSGREHGFTLEGRAGTDRIFSIIDRLGALYGRGAKSAIDLLDITDLKLPLGGRMRIELTDATPESMKALDEFFEIIAHVAERDDDTEAFLEIKEPDNECLLIKELQKES